jgi:hypothetical protein
MSVTDSDETQWLATIGRALAFLCLSAADLRDKGLAEQGALLEALGLSKKDAARLLGTSEDSLGVLLRRARAAKGGKRRPRKPRGR